MQNPNAEKLAKPRLGTPSMLIEIISTVVFVIAVTVLFDLAIPRSLVDGQSMEPTFHNDDRLVINRVNYLLNKPDRSDIVVFNAVVPSDAEKGIMLIKRVIALPGDKVEIYNQKVHVNGIELDEDYINEACSIRSCQDASWILEDDQYFVMGDNRNHSSDSRRFGPVPFDHIVGQVIFRYWPLPTIGLITHD